MTWGQVSFAFGFLAHRSVENLEFTAVEVMTQAPPALIVPKHHFF